MRAALMYEILKDVDGLGVGGTVSVPTRTEDF